MAFPSSPINGQIYNNKVFDTNRWRNLKQYKTPEDSVLDINFNSLPSVPTRVSSTLYRSNFSSVDGWSAINACTVGVSNNVLQFNSIGSDPHMGRNFFTNIAGKKLVFLAKLLAGSPIGENYTHGSSGWQAFNSNFDSAKVGELKWFEASLPQNTNEQIRLDLLGGSGAVEIYDMYLGDGAYEGDTLHNQSDTTNYNFSAASGVIRTTGILGNALYGTSSNGAVASGSLMTRSGDASFSFWRKWNGSMGSYDRPMISMSQTSEYNDYGIGIFYGYGNDLYVGANGAFFGINNIIDDTNWHHWCVTYSSSYIGVYKDGALIANRSGSVDLRSVTAYPRIGYSARSGHSQATFDNPRFYNRVLNLEEIKALANFRKNSSYAIS